MEEGRRQYTLPVLVLSCKCADVDRVGEFESHAAFVVVDGLLDLTRSLHSWSFVFGVWNLGVNKGEERVMFGSHPGWKLTIDQFDPTRRFQGGRRECNSRSTIGGGDNSVTQLELVGSRSENLFEGGIDVGSNGFDDGFARVRCIEVHIGGGN